MGRRPIYGIILGMTIWSSILSSLGWAGQESDKSKGEKMSMDLRQMVFNTEPSQLKLTFDGTHKVWGVVMEELYGDTSASLVCLADGTVSLYFGNGGGIIGMGEHDAPRNASNTFILQASDYLDQAQPTKEYPLPSKGECIFYFRTFDGLYKATSSQADIQEGRSSLTPLYNIAHEVIAQCRITEQKTKNKL